MKTRSVCCSPRVPEKFFTEPHYNGFPAILVRLPEIEVEELAELIGDAWRCMAPAYSSPSMTRDHGSDVRICAPYAAQAGHNKPKSCELAP